jgi:hypothetical protein
MGPNDSLSTPFAQGSAQDALNLRPLSIGEVLDRAFHLYFKYIAIFTALVGIVIVPSVLLSYFSSRNLIDAYIGLFQQMINSPQGTPDISKLTAAQPSEALMWIEYALLFLGFPFAYGAVVAAVSKAYLGLPVSFKDSYRFALRRWLAIFMLIFVWYFALIGVAIVLAVAILVIVGITAAVAVGLGKASAVFGIAFAILAFAAFLAAIALFMMLYLTAAISFIAVVIEKVDPFKAFSSAFARMFGAGQFWRGLVLALALLGINFGATLVAGGSGMILAYVFKSPALYLILASLTSLFFGPFAVVAAAVFYYDLRIRREGYDLQMLVERFAQPAPAAPIGT